MHRLCIAPHVHVSTYMPLIPPILIVHFSAFSCPDTQRHQLRVADSISAHPHSRSRLIFPRWVQPQAELTDRTLQICRCAFALRIFLSFWTSLCSQEQCQMTLCTHAPRPAECLLGEALPLIRLHGSVPPSESGFNSVGRAAWCVAAYLSLFPQRCSRPVSHSHISFFLLLKSFPFLLYIHYLPFTLSAQADHVSSTRTFSAPYVASRAS